MSKTRIGFSDLLKNIHGSSDNVKKTPKNLLSHNVKKKLESLSDHGKNVNRSD